MTGSSRPQLAGHLLERGCDGVSVFMSRLPRSTQQALEDAGTYMDLPKGRELFGPALPPDRVYFPSAGVAAIIARAGEGKQAGCALVGSEGYLLPASILGVDRVANTRRMLSDGRGLCVERRALLQLQHPALQQALLSFTYVMIVQMIATTLSHSSDPVSKRLVRLILMMYDRAESSELLLSHADCAAFLGVRRASVTDAMHILEGQHLISNARGIVSIVDRSALMRLAGDSYGKPENEYNRLLGRYF